MVTNSHAFFLLLTYGQDSDSESSQQVDFLEGNKRGNALLSLLSSACSCISNYSARECPGRGMKRVPRDTGCDSTVEMLATAYCSSPKQSSSVCGLFPQLRFAVSGVSGHWGEWDGRDAGPLACHLLNHCGHSLHLLFLVLLLLFGEPRQGTVSITHIRAQR